MVVVPAPTLKVAYQGRYVKAGVLFRPRGGTIGIAIGVRQGAASPDISTPDKLKAVFWSCAHLGDGIQDVELMLEAVGTLG